MVDSVGVVAVEVEVVEGHLKEGTGLQVGDHDPVAAIVSVTEKAHVPHHVIAFAGYLLLIFKMKPSILFF